MSEKLERIKPVKKGKYANVADMVRDLAGDQQFADTVADRIEQRCVIDHLMAQRAALGLSQKDIADKMGCTQSRVSKLESGTDNDLRIGDLGEYADALDLDVTFVLAKKGRTLADQVKHHVFAMRRLLHRIVELAGHDAEIVNGTRGFFGEVILNSVDSVMAANKTLTRYLEKARQDGLLDSLPQEPPPAIQMDDADDADESDLCQKPRRAARRGKRAEHVGV